MRAKKSDKPKEEKKDLEEERRKILEQLEHFRGARTFGQKSADMLTKIAGSWGFILTLFGFLIAWMIVNGYFLIQYQQGNAFDPYPFILLNLVLSCLAAVQAPIILMSQNRQAQRDRIKSEYDYRINKKAEEEIRQIRNLLIKRNKK